MAGYTGIFMISAAMLLLQLALVRLFAVQQFHHFAFMAISMALLGNGVSGSLLSLRGRSFSPLLCCLGFSLTAIGTYLVINSLPFDSYSIAWDTRQIFYLALYFLAAGVPFLFCGLVIGGALMEAGREATGGSHRVYGANLAGSAAGSIGSLLVIAIFGGVGTVIVAALIGLLAGVCFLLKRNGWRDHGREVNPALMAIFTAGVIVAVTVILVAVPGWREQNISPYKSLAILKQMPDAKHTITRWDAASQVDVVESSAIHIMPGLSLFSAIGPPPQAGLTVDGDQLMPITSVAPNSSEAALLADNIPTGAVYRLRPEADTLVLEAGTGLDVLFALASGAAQVTAVDDNRLIFDVVREDYRDFTHNLYTHPRVTLVSQLGRVFIRQSGNAKYDVVIVSLKDPHRPVTSGAYSLTENYVYTVEAFEDYLSALNPDGVLLITRWLQTPPSECGRTFATAVAALRARGLPPAGHLMAFRSMRTVTILASPQPFSGADVDSLRSFLSERGFDGIYYPGIRADELNRFNILPEDDYYELFTSLLSDPQTTADEYHFDIHPPTDDRPFFFHYFKWRQTPEILAALGFVWQPFGGSGYFVLIALLVLVLLASAGLIVGPLLLKRKHPHQALRHADGGKKLRIFIYFGSIGLAYLFVEVSLAQRFILMFGKPVIALAVVFFSILLFSGLGSLTVRRWSMRWGMGLLVCLVAVYPLLVRPMSMLALQQPEWARILFSILFLSPLGYLMGLPFAAGLRVVEKQDAALVPWAWAINGSFSVISAVTAVIVMMSNGFSGVIWLGGVAYIGALLAFFSYFSSELGYSSSRVKGTKRT
ncbi:MAG: hypothetical protein U1B80_08850 [Anaerolineaceae bacterium]|nr:hypothetical protein [Anaerolineaceae bacterium]